MAAKKIENVKSRRIASVSSITMVLFLTGVFILKTQMDSIPTNFSFLGLVMLAALIVVIAVIRNTVNHQKLALTIPVILLSYHTILTMASGWLYSNYLLICLAFCAISCIYSSFNRTAVYIFIQNTVIGFFVFRGAPVCGLDVPVYIIYINWAISIFGSLIMLLLTRSATILLDKALEQQNSFRDLLDTTENYVAMINESNEVVYASKTLARLGNSENPLLVQGRPLIDLFPGKSLKIHAGKLLKEKDDYAEDWEFSLHGQKRYFKAISHSLPGGTGGTLISLYDMTHLAERDEIAVMKDSMKLGLFFMDKNYIIQDHYSRFLEELLSENNLFGKLFTDIISDSVTTSELEAIKDYFGMILERSYDQEMLDEINPLNELHYVNKRTGDRKVFQCTFATVERGRGEVFILITIYDITARIELQQRLAEEEARRQEEMQAVFELIQVEPDVFNDFMADMEHEYTSIDKILKDETMTAHEVLVKVYQSIHAIKSNAVILGLNIYGDKLHALESKIKKLREMTEEIPFGEMLNLTMDIEKVSQERDNFREILDKLKSYAGSRSGGGGEKQNVKVMVDGLEKAISKASADVEKQVRLINEVDAEAIDKGPRRAIKEILMQLVRNSVVHGIELPEERQAKGKNETGTCKLLIKMSVDRKHIEIKFSDDGKGLDYKKIAERAIQNNLIKPEDANNKDALMKAIFSPGFSTAENEGVHAGRGIGLNLVRDRIKEVNGNIKVRSEKDKGTLFLISLPVPKNPA